VKVSEGILGLKIWFCDLVVMGWVLMMAVCGVGLGTIEVDGAERSLAGDWTTISVEHESSTGLPGCA
jgi:hypothetical protein